MGSQSVQWMQCARVLRRAGFGATGSEIDAAHTLPVADYLRAQLDGSADPGAGLTPLPVFTEPVRPGRDAATDVRKRYQSDLTGQLQTLTGWWVRRMATAQRPLPEKLTLLWHNHFATSASKVRSATEMAGQNETLRRLGAGDFGTLAYAMLTDPAMLRWLDGIANTAKAPNENLSREFMELFALGHGNGYSETDVREGARALTGWTIAADGSARLDPKRHDTGSKTVLGVTGSLDAREFCTAVLARPESARFVAGRMWQQLAAGAPPSAAALDRLTAAYGPGRDITRLVVAVLTDAEFLSGTGTVVQGPVEWLVGAVRALAVPVGTDAQVKTQVNVLRTLGQVPFYPPSVGGWSSGQAWLSTAAAQTRLRAATGLAQKADLSWLSGTGATDRIDAVGHRLGIGHWSDRSAAVLASVHGDPIRLTAIALNTPEYLTS
ncbi:DUF1800 domain-containing protein [Nocardia sp. NPDC006630]|uniref:DUF1800 domain-containing protein n=1 Tax=Nocardia sp. NPDC006630 TaxID=3157181 RepID=UPI0033A98BE6